MSDLPLYGARATDVIDAILPESARDASKGVDKQLAEQHRVSTDPNWLKPITPATGTAKPSGQVAPPVDGRHGRSTTTRANIIAGCRELMMGGVFRPTMEEVCERARRSKRSGHQHFTTIEALHFEALQDGVVREAVLERAVGPQMVFLMPETRDRLLRAIITGRA